MKYFKDNNNNVYAYDDEQIEMGLSDDKTPMTDAEVEAHLNPPKSTEQLIAEAKAQKAEALANITVTTRSGKVFDGDESARNNMLSAIAVADFLGKTEADWKLADNTIETITLVELKEALALSIQKVGEIIGVK